MPAHHSHVSFARQDGGVLSVLLLALSEVEQLLRHRLARACQVFDHLFMHHLMPPVHRFAHQPVIRERLRHALL